MDLTFLSPSPFPSFTDISISLSSPLSDNLYTYVSGAETMKDKYQSSQIYLSISTFFISVSVEIFFLCLCQSLLLSLSSCPLSIFTSVTFLCFKRPCGAEEIIGGLRLVFHVLKDEPESIHMHTCKLSRVDRAALHHFTIYKYRGGYSTSKRYVFKLQ